MINIIMFNFLKLCLINRFSKIAKLLIKFSNGKLFSKKVFDLLFYYIHNNGIYVILFFYITFITIYNLNLKFY